MKLTVLKFALVSLTGDAISCQGRSGNEEPQFLWEDLEFSFVRLRNEAHPCNTGTPIDSRLHMMYLLECLRKQSDSACTELPELHCDIRWNEDTLCPYPAAFYPYRGNDEHYLLKTFEVMTAPWTIDQDSGCDGKPLSWKGVRLAFYSGDPYYIPCETPWQEEKPRMVNVTHTTFGYFRHLARFNDLDTILKPCVTHLMLPLWSSVDDTYCRYNYDWAATKSILLTEEPVTCKTWLRELERAKLVKPGKIKYGTCTLVL